MPGAGLSLRVDGLIQFRGRMSNADTAGLFEEVVALGTVEGDHSGMSEGPQVWGSMALLLWLGNMALNQLEAF